MTVRLALTVTVQVPVPGQAAALQLARVMLVSGVPVKVTTVPEGTVRVQVAPQLIPAGLEVIVPVPVPLIALVRVTETGAAGAGGVVVSELQPAISAVEVTSDNTTIPKRIAPLQAFFMIPPALKLIPCSSAFLFC